MPVSVTVANALPAKTLAGETCASVGVGLFTTRLIALAEPLPPLLAVTDRVAPLASWPAGTIAVTSVLLTNVVASAAPLTWITVDELNPVPVTVKVVAELPAVREEVQ